MASRPQNWDFHKEQIQGAIGFGKDAFKNASRNLSKHGYLQITKTRSQGKFDKLKFTLFFTPNNQGGLTAAVQPSTDNPPLNNTDSNNTDRSINSKLSAKNQKALSCFEDSIYLLFLEFLNYREQKTKTLCSQGDISNYIENMIVWQSNKLDVATIIKVCMEKGWRDLFLPKELAKRTLSKDEILHNRAKLAFDTFKQKIPLNLWIDYYKVRPNEIDDRYVDFSRKVREKHFQIKNGQQLLKTPQNQLIQEITACIEKKSSFL